MSALSRAEFLRLTLGAFALPRVGDPFGLRAGRSDTRFAPQPAAASSDPRRDRIVRLFEQFDAQGFHRTATEVDNQSGRWLADLAGGSGAEGRLDPFTIGRVDIRSAYLEANGRRVDGVPFFDGSFTDAHGIGGRLTAEIALTTIDQNGISSEGQAIAALRRSTSHRGVVAVTNGAHAGLSLSNAGSFAAPYGVPVLQVSSAERDWLNELAANGREIRFVVDATRTTAQAFNVVATVPGRDSSLGPLIVMTPRSGWWHCASERGGGIACWTEAIRAVAGSKPRRSLIAIASSGHELGHFGLDAYLAKQPGLIKRATWIHLGANIGAANGVPRLQASDDEIESMAASALTRAGGAVRQRVPRGPRPGGEARNIHDGGGRYVSLLGSGPYFHNVADRWPTAVDLEAVTRFSAAFSDLAVALSA